ncbi:hypothetical protein [Azospirillum sp. TSO5]|uniref:spike base protein, RCAP_Rcc01079 family n=1 Tax=Azospirillum sp. TSO5 TaxID=716760 RepID=UPI000D620E57|nr:hypothetical protein [Azospirillum sp. TSO5]PWC96962.1 hypothetical protein TSO5_05895 [Azospirillum sp. TSO5]
MADQYANLSPDLASPYIGGFAVSPSDSAVLSQPTRAVFVGGAGNLAVTYLDGSTDTLQSVTAGSILPIRVTKVMATNTTATKISGLY